MCGMWHLAIADYEEAHVRLVDLGGDGDSNSRVLEAHELGLLRYTRRHGGNGGKRR